MEELEKYHLPVDGKFVEVTEEQYHAFYKYRRREKYLEERDNKHKVCHYCDLDTDELLGEEMFSYPEEISVEEQVVDKMLLENLLRCVRELPEEDQIFIHDLYYQKKTEREYAEELGVAQATVNYQRNRIISILKKKMNSL